MNVLVIVPTYDERENIEGLVRAVLTPKSADAVSLLVVDDGSPDGTGAVVRRMMEEPCFSDRLHLLERERKGGLAGAYLAGLTWGLGRPFDLFVEMDADLSHDPRYLPDLIEAARRVDFVVGSRYVRGGRVVGWGPLRRFVSRAGSLYSRILLGSRIRDLTGGYNAWNRRVLEQVDLHSILSKGYSFQIELKCRAASRGFTWIELPIIFKDRVRGRSKMSAGIALEALRRVLALSGQVQHG